MNVRPEVVDRSSAVDAGWLCLAAGLLVTLVVARPWRALLAAQQPPAVSVHR